MDMTHKQKQQLLGYLGYYDGDTDGIWGPKSREAARLFQREWQLAEDEAFGQESQEKILSVIGAGGGLNWWSGIRFFSREEFRCRCGGKYCDGFPAEPQEQLVELAEQVRGHFGKPVVVSSGLRCKRHNAACGGVANSRHLTGRAVDFRVAGETAGSVLDYVLSLSGVRYAYAIDGSYVHMDIE